MEKLKLLLIVFFIGFSFNSWAQEAVSGVVSDANNVPIPGANISIKGTTVGAATDFDGNFTIKAKKGDVFVVSYLGYKTQEITYAGSATLNVTLQEDNAQLDEVVVIGYGAVKKNDLTGSVSTVSSKQIEQANKVDAISALQGQTAGVVIQRTDNKPGSGGFNIRVRGSSTILNNKTADNGGFTPGRNPLFIVDGIFLDDISFLNPADISRMDILKDASATAIYGSRGSNGVVLIETKSGKSGVLKVNYSNYVGFKEAYNLPTMQDGPGYIEYMKDVVVGNKFAANQLGYRRGDVVVSDYLDAEELQNVADGINTNWTNLILKKGFQTNHTLNLSGGSEKTVYSAGLGYTKDEGTLGGESFERFNIRGSLKSDLNKWSNISVSNYITNAIQNAGSYEGFRSSYRLKPIGRPYNADGTLKFFPTAKETQITNPLFEPDYQTKETKYLQYLGDIALEIKPFVGLTLTTKFSPNIKYARYGEYRGLYSKDVVGQPSLRRAQVNNSNYLSYSWDNILNYKFEKGIHALTVTAVMSRFMERTENYYSQVRNFSTDDFSFHNLGAGLDINTLSSDYAKQTLESYTARINYTLKDKYLFTITSRYDGSSVLAEGNKWSFFPSAAFGWKLIDEDFMKSQKIFSNAKIRLSYGETGNNGGLPPLSSQSLLDAGAVNIGDSPISTASLGRLANKDLTWERTAEVNLGFDFGFLNNKINGSIDIYNRKNTNLILYTELPTVTGFPGVLDNVGESMNKGIEIGLNTTNIDNGDFKWTTNFNFSSNKNTVKKLYGSTNQLFTNDSGINMIITPGQPVGAIYDYVFDGIWQLDEAAEAAVYGQTPGQVKVKDINGDGKLTDEEDRQVIGQVAPKWNGSVTSTMNFKNFDFTFLITTSQGSTVSSSFHNNTIFPYDGEPARLFNAAKVNYWTPENPSNSYYQPGNGGRFSNLVKYKDVSFTKVGFITLGYTVPKGFLDKLKISSLRIYSTVQNPFVFTKYDGWDPENAGRNAWGAAFMSRTYMAGINVNF
ncbi:SusC/RagA family TonB-linked outer membrane protein [Confluentibacter sediminis]|uniref:SusC/RagA family TonB-linked outer membrane protein n=1 Tax=Confluentibacter sediminis TaxID=2219045 RepID=UPI000DADEC11|nr:TonB-dependent receptor [Confluentibacter sediminis]